ncbi:MAG: hypothetical protein ACREYE_23605 [Gammaproteobacteria bacterium]
MTEKVTGTVAAIRRDGRGFKVGEDWYGVYNPAEIEGLQRGSEVSFEYTTSARGFNDVRGPVVVTPRGADASGEARAAPPTVASRDAAVAPRGGAQANPSGYVSDRDRQASIVRQNALTNAVAYLRESASATTDGVIEVAKKFEAYTSGQSSA